MPNRFHDDVVILTALASEMRMRVLSLIRYEEMSVTDIARSAGISQSALSQHLAKLKTAGLVASRREAQTRYYKMVSPGVSSLLSHLETLFAENAEAPLAA